MSSKDHGDTPNTSSKSVTNVIEDAHSVIYGQEHDDKDTYTIQHVAVAYPAPPVKTLKTHTVGPPLRAIFALQWGTKEKVLGAAFLHYNTS